MIKINRTIISVSDKEGITNFAKGLNDFDIEILSTGGTAKKLRDGGSKVTDISDYTKSKEIFSGRVKTLHPKIHGGLLAIRDNENHLKEMKENKIEGIEMVVVNLYPFEEVIKKDDVDLEEAIENIDIGGPAMLRSAAKNYKYVTIVTDPEDYKPILKELKKNKGKISPEINFRLAVKAFSYVARYDAAISNFLSSIQPDGSRTKLPSSYTLHLEKKMGLRYGENPHQDGAFYVEHELTEPSISNAVQLQGKELSLNNIFDTNSAFELVKEFKKTACVIVKHNNPCGVAQSESAIQAFLKAKECDPISAFGGIIALNTELDEATAEEIIDMFVEVIIAPSYTEKALYLLSTKKNVRVLQTPKLGKQIPYSYDIKKVIGGALIQDRDMTSDSDFQDYAVPTKRKPTASELEDLKFAWKVCKHVKSNAIIYAKNYQTVGIGAGQMSRVDSVQIAKMKAQMPTEGCVLASDAFFPFRDALDEAAKAGIKAVVQPGGSIRDEEIVDAANEHGMAMVLTSVRHFKH
ncbi:MAG: bifunctional phosphoribosylaminoimidazolecarboxamide formyltransferase/IMP cyclohydrolase [Thermodesulfobacteriota bacterium]